jgi:hypothetical protein
MLSTCNCQNLASDTTEEYECDGIGIHDIEGRDGVAMGIVQAGLARPESCPLGGNLADRFNHVLA